jgi:pimeloyl-ACP methyl ester carboxylesterase
MQTTSPLSLSDGVSVRPAPREIPSRTQPRAVPKPPPLARAAVRAAAVLAPARTAQALARRFLTPRRVRLEEHERDLLAAADRLEVPFAGRRLGLGEHAGSVAAYAWGGEGPTVLLVHGWSSAAGQLAAFVDPLRRLGFRVAAFDAPAHGASGGTTTNALEISEVVLAAGRVLGPLHAVIGHSAGAAATARAVTHGLAAGRLALVSPWTRPQTWVERFAAAFGLSRSMTARLIRAVESEAGEPLDAIDLEAVAPAVANPTLVVHDRDDALVGIADVRAAAAALPAGTLVETHGLGHSRILRASEVVGRVVGFVAGEGRAAAC